MRQFITGGLWLSVAILFFLAWQDFSEARQSVEAPVSGLCAPAETQVINLDAAQEMEIVLDRGVTCVLVRRD